MSNRGRTIVLLFLVLVIVCLLVFNYLVSQFGLFWRSQKEVLLKAPPPLPVLSSPLDKNLAEVFSLSAADSNHLAFFLNEEAPVLAMFDGEVWLVEEGEEFNNIQVKDKSGLIVSYIFTGEILVEEGKRVASGEQIGLVDPSRQGISCLGGGNLGVYLLNENGSVRLVKEMIKRE